MARARRRGASARPSRGTGRRRWRSPHRSATRRLYVDKAILTKPCLPEELESNVRRLIGRPDSS